MTDFMLYTPENAPEGSRTQLASVAKAWGFVPTLHATLAESPAALIGYDTLLGLIAQSTLTPAEQQVVFLTVSVFHDCRYCTAGHTYLARQSGLAETEIQALRNGTALSDPRLAALERFARAVVEKRGNVGDAAVDAFIAAGFTRQNVLEVVTVIAAKTISNYVNHLTHTPHETFMADPALAWSKSGQHAAA